MIESWICTDIKNIAVCFSGEPRTYNMCAESIKSFFDLPNINVRFFGHTWNTNSYKIGNFPNTSWEYEEYPIDFIKNDISKLYNFENLQVEQKYDTVLAWDHLFYSELKSNILKRNYEKENNMTFDVVIKCRFDLAFEPNITFMQTLSPEPNRAGIVHQKKLYVPTWLMTPELYLTNIDDCFYYGSSLTMDLLQSNMFYINRNHAKFLFDDENLERHHRGYTDMIGPGVRMYLWCNKVNITLNNVHRKFFIYRKQQLFQDPVKNYETMLNEGSQIF